jgi:hypothetical protein
MARARDRSPGEPAVGGRVVFWIHQLVELLLGILLMVQGARTGEHTAVLVTLGGLLLLLALCSDGALGAWPWIGRRLHRVLDLVVVAVLALSPLVLGLDHVLPIVFVEVAAGAMLWLALRTEWRAPVRRRARRPSAVAPKTPGTAGGSAAPDPWARKLGRAAGQARDDGPRQLGRLVGKAQRAAKAAVAHDSRASDVPEPPESPDSPGSAPRP